MGEGGAASRVCEGDVRHTRRRCGHCKGSVLGMPVSRTWGGGSVVSSGRELSSEITAAECHVDPIKRSEADKPSDQNAKTHVAAPHVDVEMEDAASSSALLGDEDDVVDVDAESVTCTADHISVTDSVDDDVTWEDHVSRDAIFSCCGSNAQNVF